MTELYFDFISPFSYFLFERLKPVRDTNSDLTFSPVLLINLLSHWGQTPPAQVRPKRLFLFREALRYAKKNSIDFMVPNEHPFNSLQALRMSTSFCAKQCEVSQIFIIESLWSYIWKYGKNINDLESLTTHLNEAGLPGLKLVEASYSKESKSEVKANCEKAISMDVFGVPTIVHKNEVFWGNQSWDDFQKFKETGDLGYDKNYYNHLTQK